MNASKSLKEAADVISSSSSALQLRFEDLFFSWEVLPDSEYRIEWIKIFRYLQTLTTIATERNSTIVFPIPIEMLKGMSGGKTAM